MKLRWLAAAFAAGVALSGAARAADTLAYGPAPAWIKPPVLEPNAAIAAGGASAVVLMQDREVRYGADYDEIYDELAYKAVTPAGLNALGTITRSWNPATTAVTVNRLEIIRGGQVIDALAPNSPAGSDPFLVLRRETNLNIATLDGALTATKQLNGLQVGDIVHMAVTSRYHDPLLGGLTQDATLIDGPVAHAQVRLLWPNNKPVRWQAGAGLGEPKITRTSDGTELLIDRRDLAPMVPAAGAPGRYYRLGVLQVSELADWQALSRLFSPLYDKAATLSADSPLKAEAQKIRAANPTQAGQAAAALKLVEDQVRYVALAMGEGGLNPAAADQTWSRRFGDCKGKTVLLMALLRELGIEARPALVSSQGADALDKVLPSVGVFDHVIVRAVVDGKVYWLDGTRLGDGALAELPVPDMDFALPLTTAGAGLEKLVVPFPAAPQEERLMAIDLSAGRTDRAPAKVEYRVRGDMALAARQLLAELDASQRDTTLKSVLKSEFNEDFTKVGVTDKDGVVTVTGETNIDVGWYTDSATRRPAVVVGGAVFGYFDAPDRSSGFDRDAPLLLDYPNYESYRVVVTLPGDGAGFDPRGADSDITAGGVRITRTSHLDGRILTIDQTSRTPDQEAPLSAVTAAVARFKAAPTADAVVLLAPRDFAVTASQLAKTAAAAPTDAAALVELGDARVNQGNYAEAIRQYSAAIAAQPDYGPGWWARGWAKAVSGDLDGALADTEKGVAVDPKVALGRYYRGRVRRERREYEQAAADFADALAIEPNLDRARSDRIGVLVQLKRYDEAQAEVDAGLKLNPDDSEWRAAAAGLILARMPPGTVQQADIQASIRKGFAGVSTYEGLVARGRALLNAGLTDGLDDLTAAIRLNPDRPEAYSFRGAYYLAHDRAADGAKDMDKLVELSPTAASYLARGDARLAAKNYDGATADYVAAAAKNPESDTPGRALAMVAVRRGDIAGGIAQLDKVIAAHPDLVGALTQQALLYSMQKAYDRAAANYERAFAIGGNPEMLSQASELYERGGDYVHALADLDRALAQKPGNATLLNNRCYLKATRNIQIDTAVADCDAALKLAPNEVDFLDSRGLAYVRLGQWDKAIADYDAALKTRPTLADSLYGRGIARARKGDRAGSKDDIAAARRADKDIAKTFADYGLKP